jgi:hypothetical protein
LTGGDLLGATPHRCRPLPAPGRRHDVDLQERNRGPHASWQLCAEALAEPGQLFHDSVAEPQLDAARLQCIEQCGTVAEPGIGQHARHRIIGGSGSPPSGSGVEAMQRLTKGAIS